jgi:hypothetical protein
MLNMDKFLKHSLKVYFILSGDASDTSIRALKCDEEAKAKSKILQTGSTNSFVMSVNG